MLSRLAMRVVHESYGEARHKRHKVMSQTRNNIGRSSIINQASAFV